MYKENLFRLIRSGEVVIWAGAGFSIYAGYPSGNDLSKTIYNSLNSSEKEIINKNLQLSELAEEVIRIKGNSRNSLVKILNEVFQKKPKSIEFHEKLATIPHIKSIITTNYDNLFELAYGTEGQKIINEKQIPYIHSNKVNILKIHGDLSNVDSLMISKSDYLEFFKKGSESLLWNLVKERIATKSVLFLGYNLEDINISMIFERISESLGTHMKENFLVAPNLPSHKINDLIRKNINYIDCTGEELISELLEDIKKNIIEDFENGLVEPEIFRKFLSNNNLLPDLIGESEKFNLKGIKPKEGEIEGKIQFTINDDKELVHKFNDFILGKKFEDVEISDKRLINAVITLGGLTLPMKSDGVYSLTFQSKPQIEDVFDLSFENGFELFDLPVKVFASKHFIEVIVLFKNIKLFLNSEINNLQKQNIDFHISIDEPYLRTKDGIEIFTLLKLLHSGEKFTAHLKNGKSIDLHFHPKENSLADSITYLNYFNNLKIIETFYNLRFKNIQNISSETFKKVNTILRAINEEAIVVDYNNLLTFEIDSFSDEILSSMRKIQEMNAPVAANHLVNEEIEIHDHKFNIGFQRLELLDPYITNFKSVMSKRTKLVKLKSKTKRMKISYRKGIEE